MLYVIGLLLPICVKILLQMIVGEYFYAKRCNADTTKMLFGYNIPTWLWGAYEKIGIFGFGAASTVLITDIAKYTIGRLRPHFMTLCVPNVNCNLPENQHRYIENYSCTSNISRRLLKEIRKWEPTSCRSKIILNPSLDLRYWHAVNALIFYLRIMNQGLKQRKDVDTEHLSSTQMTLLVEFIKILSFPSGHSSFSAYTMIYLALYLQLRMTWKGSKLLKHFLQLLCLLMAWFTALSRVSDYKHHWSDVLAGSTLGTIVALVVKRKKAKTQPKARKETAICLTLCRSRTKTFYNTALLYHINWKYCVPVHCYSKQNRNELTSLQTSLQTGLVSYNAIERNGEPA
ncbi:Putative phosphatidate phosphatase [Melipona quadrifasciata]|uniref:Putative phosphatidate phosphatase n=1 Tax=Melipona quadrifasciata TaxID=166423 RepID=A0A0M8ZWX2_9HYME|nr:Putative phosphatidate phosphatase [Melipona quadrifasciata]